MKIKGHLLMRIGLCICTSDALWVAVVGTGRICPILCVCLLETDILSMYPSSCLELESL